VRRDWSPIIEAAVGIVDEYDYLITLRQLHYRLLSLPDLDYGSGKKDYDYLSDRTAQARRRRNFPALSDQTRRIEQVPFWASPQAALADLIEQYRLDRSEGQEFVIVLGGEKRAMLAQFRQWYPDLGLPFIALSGNASQSYVDEVAAFVEDDGRKSVLLYVGDLDAAGEEIEEDFCRRCDVWDHVERIAVTEEQVTGLGLPRLPGKPNDPKRKPFIERHGWLFGVEVEAIPPDLLRSLYDDALATYWDKSTYDAVVAREHKDRAELAEAARLINRKEQP
jgi:hypothetical protein